MPPLSEAIWYAALRRIRRWAAELPESELIRRSTCVGLRFAHLTGRPAGPCVAMARGLALTLHCRTRGISALDKFDPRGAARWAAFVRDTQSSSKAVFVSAHLGPFELQMDLLSTLPNPVLFLYRAYRWPPLRRLIESFRRSAPNLTYLEYRQSREILRAIDQGCSLAVLGDQSPPTRALSALGRRTLDSFPLRVASSQGIPLFVGGLFSIPGRECRLGFDFHRIDPSTSADPSGDYVDAFERTIRNNPSDWVCFA